MTDDRDIVPRLREPRHDGYEPCLVDQRAMRDAADEIERLRAALKRVEAGLTVAAGAVADAIRINDAI